MPARPKGPWFYKGRGYYATLGGKSVNLFTEDLQDAWDAFYALMTEAGKDVDESARPEADPVSVGEVLERFGEWAERHRKPNTASQYDQFIQSFRASFPEADDTPAADLRPFHVQRWIDAHDSWGSTTQNRAAAAIKRAYSWAVQQGILNVDPIRSLRKAKPQRRLQILTAEEWGVLLGDGPEKELRALLRLQQLTGARPIELREMQVSNYDRRGKCLRWELGKGDRPRVIVLVDEADALVREAIGGRTEGEILRNQSGDPWTRAGLRMAIRRLRKATGVHFVANTARHSYATDALANGVDAVTVGYLMGHTDPSMVAKVYSHLEKKPDYLREAAEKAIRRSDGKQTAGTSEPSAAKPRPRSAAKAARPKAKPGRRRR